MVLRKSQQHTKEKEHLALNQSKHQICAICVKNIEHITHQKHIIPTIHIIRLIHLMLTKHKMCALLNHKAVCHTR